MTSDQYVLNCLIRLSILLLIGWGLLWMFRRRDPLWSVWIVRCMTLSCVLLPIICLGLPSFDLGVLPAKTPIENSNGITTNKLRVFGSDDFSANAPLRVSDSPTDSKQQALRRNDIEPVTGNGISERPSSPGARSSSEIVVTFLKGLPLFRIFGFVWVLVGFVLLIQLVLQLVRTRRMFAHSRPLSPSEVNRIRRLEFVSEYWRERIAISDDLECPCTGGVLHARIYIPRRWFEERSDEQLKAIIAHEQAHVNGRDLTWDIGCRIAFACWWFHPCVWALAGRHRLSCELVSDMTAGSTVNDMSLYRRWLAQWTIARQSQCSHKLQPSAGSFAMADHSLMLRRLGLLKQGYLGTRPSQRTILLFLLLASLFGMAMALINVTRAMLSEPPQQSAHSNTKLAPESDNSQSTRTLVVRVSNEQNEPIAGASVSVGRWEFADKPSQHMPLEDRLTTNEQGEVSFEAPVDAIKTILWVVCEGYSEESLYETIRDRIDVTLQQGDRVRVRVVDEQGNAMPQAIPILENQRRFPKEFEIVDINSGTFLSPAITKGRDAMFVVAKEKGDDGKTQFLFSNWIHVSEPEQQDKDGTIVAVVKPGVKLRGRLDDSVPRPIQFGFVELCVAESLEYNNLLKAGSRWRDRVEIRRDGSFEFAGIPFGSHAQIFAITESYLSKPPSDIELLQWLQSAGLDAKNISQQMEGLRRAYLPRFVPLDQALVELPEPVECVPTASVDVRVIDPSGSPISNALVAFNPNGRFFGADLFIAGTGEVDTHRFDGHFFAANESSFDNQCRKWAFEKFILVPTDTDGIAKIRALPVGYREGFKVTAPGYVMPVHPTTFEAKIDISTLDRDSPQRYAAVELVSGETQRKTITMERYVKRGIRELHVVNEDGKAVTGVNVTIAEVAMSDSPDDWLTWNGSRFGAMANAESNEVGLVRLEVPLEAEDKSIGQLKIAISGEAKGLGFVQRQYCDIPVVNDEGVLRLTKAQAQPKNPKSVELEVSYVLPNSVFSASKNALLEQLSQSPSLALLIQLLQANEFDAVTPLRFRTDRNMLGRNGMPIGMDPVAGKTPGGSIAHVSTEYGDRVIVLCDVRPKGAKWDQAPWSGLAPEAALVFEANTGKLIRMVGGEFSASQNTSSVMLVNMGGSDDYFIETSYFENHAPFEMVSRWYHLGREEKPALTTYNYANATAWYGRVGIADPPGEFGYMQYGFNGKSIDYWLSGKTQDGLVVPRKIYWDASSDSFSGPNTQSLDGKPLYLVDESNSMAFVPFRAERDKPMIAGGRSEKSFEYQWDIVIPEGKTAVVLLDELETTNADSPLKSLAKLHFDRGQNSLQVLIFDAKEDPSKSEIRVFVNYGLGNKPTSLFVPKVSPWNEDLVEPTKVIRSFDDAVDLIERTYQMDKGRVRVRIEVE